MDSLELDGYIYVCTFPVLHVEVMPGFTDTERGSLELLDWQMGFFLGLHPSCNWLSDYVFFIFCSWAETCLTGCSCSLQRGHCNSVQ